MEMVKAAELVLDFDVYPRPSIDSQHISEMCEAMKAGYEFPPVVADKKSKRVADGFHRVRTALRVQGTDAEISVVFKSYRTDKALYRDAMRYNARHGKNLTQYDRAHCAIIGEKMGLTVAEIAADLAVTVDRIEGLMLRKTARSNGDRVALKRTIRHKAGEKLTRKQQKANEALGGMNQLFYVNQLIMLIENDLLDRKNETLMERMEHLKGIL